ncbi:MAG: D-alanyl-D-alanine carboxypeptidase/D-alanyl-D-alanine-endopeptidase [Zoogloeaceae bacterium]|jgi:D-alanyl-D-alanine carboxypeptidase/D-alanyl-D-alanine-endopeptidase (penicillin-binding protein 4)|nr:D-alanyl-D-alanine carboxypeptidase/D-alanyl-D-alanine-endopeptidase [Zoogloeaceae bacterium]
MPDLPFRKKCCSGFALAVLLFFAAPLRAQDVVPLPPTVVQALAAARIPESSVAVVVQVVDQKTPRINHNAQLVMNPASVMKLVTTYAALGMLGPAANWQTGFWSVVEADATGRLPGHLYLKGGGDPDFSLERFWMLLRQLRARGVRHIDGDLVLDRSRFTLPPHDPAAFDHRPLRAYNVGPDALLVDANALRFLLRPEGEQVRFSRITPHDNLEVVTRIVPGKGGCNGWRERLNYVWQANRLEISGSYPTSCDEQSLLLAPLSPEAHVQELFRALWREMGGTLRGKVRTGQTPVEARRLATQNSPPVAEIVRSVNKWSNNVMARQLLLALGGEEGTPESAVRQTQDWLRAQGLDFPELVLENGSGLSRQERINAQSLNRLLIHAWHSAVMPEVIASLPISAVDGTMQKRLRDTPAAGHAHIKTGSLSGAKTAAGYVQDLRGKRYAVTFLINHANAAQGEKAMDALLLWVVAQKTEDSAGN